MQEEGWKAGVGEQKAERHIVRGYDRKDLVRTCTGIRHIVRAWERRDLDSHVCERRLKTVSPLRGSVLDFSDFGFASSSFGSLYRLLRRYT